MSRDSILNVFKKRCQRSFLLLFMIVNGRIEQYRL